MSSVGDNPISVEGLMNKLALVLFFLFGQALGAAEPKVLAIHYVKSFFASVHQNNSRYSVVLTTLSCGFPVKVLEIPQTLELKFTKVRAGMHEGYIRSELLSESQEVCFQDRYPRFIDQLDLDLESMHYFGRLYDLYVEGSSNVK